MLDHRRGRRRRRQVLFDLPSVAPLAAPILQILPAQLLVEHVAGLRGLPIGELRRHQDDTKVVV